MTNLNYHWMSFCFLPVPASAPSGSTMNLNPKQLSIQPVTSSSFSILLIQFQAAPVRFLAAPVRNRLPSHSSTRLLHTARYRNLSATQCCHRMCSPPDLESASLFGSTVTLRVHKRMRYLVLSLPSSFRHLLHTDIHLDKHFVQLAS